MSELIKALVKAQGAVTPAIKGAVNPHFKSRYADLGAVMEVAQPALTANGLALMFAVTSEGTAVTLTPIILHVGGEKMELPGCTFPAGRADPQAFGSVITYGRRYLTMSLLGIPTEDDDGESASRVIREKPAQTVAKPSQATGDTLATLEGQLPAIFGTKGVFTPEELATYREDWKSIKATGNLIQAREFVAGARGMVTARTNGDAVAKMNAELDEVLS
jgi:hypothetical protein